MTVDEEITQLEETLRAARQAADAESQAGSVIIQGISEKLYSALAQRARSQPSSSAIDDAKDYERMARDACREKANAAAKGMADDMRALKRAGNTDEDVRKKVADIRPRGSAVH